MTSAGEVPVGPDEYAVLRRLTEGRLPFTTNVGVRVNTRLLQTPPEIWIPQAQSDEESFIAKVVDSFSAFLHTPNNEPRPLTVRLGVKAPTLSRVAPIVERIEAARSDGKLGPRELHRLAALVVFDTEITSQNQYDEVKKVIDAASTCGVNEVVIDGELRTDARKHISAQSLLNVLGVGALRALLRFAASKHVSLSYRYQIDVDTVARTIWTGLEAARSHDCAAGKFGLVPLTLAEQQRAMSLIMNWTRGWRAIPAFYVDTPLVTDDDVYDSARCVEGACVWLSAVADLRVPLVLFDCPDRVAPRRLLKTTPDDTIGILTLADVDVILAHARSLGVEILWSGGITASQAVELARRHVHGIFSTSSTAKKMPVSPGFARDLVLAAENEPTEFGIRRIHSLIQAGFLQSALGMADPALATSLGKLVETLLATERDPSAGVQALAALDAQLVKAWAPTRAALAAQDGKVPPNAVRVFRGRRRSSVPHAQFVEKLASIFMPVTVQMQRRYGLAAYLPAVIPPITIPRYPTKSHWYFTRHNPRTAMRRPALAVAHIARCTSLSLIWPPRRAVSQRCSKALWSSMCLTIYSKRPRTGRAGRRASS